MIRILIVDDHALIRAGIKELLEKQPDIEVAGEAGNGAEAIRMAGEISPDIILLDMELPDIDGIEVISILKPRHPEIKMIILTMFSNAELASRCLDAGASGFLVKGISPKELPEAVKKVYEGSIYVASSIKDNILYSRYSLQGKKNPVSFLSKRELQVLTELARGLNMREVADKLSLSHSTIKTHKTRIQEKLKLENISDIIHFAVRHGLIKKY